MHIRFSRVLGISCLLLALCLHTVCAQVVINEIHANPDLETERVEFVELYNAGTKVVDLTGWRLNKGVLYHFAPGVALPAGGFLVVAEYPAAVLEKFVVSPAVVVGPFTGKLANDGEEVELLDANARQVDSVTYGLGFPWPTVGDPIAETQPGTASSIQLVNPALDNNLGGSWRSAYPTPGVRNTVFADNLPPQIRQVIHQPEQPRAGETVTITAKVTDTDGVKAVTLQYQIVEPGAYLALTDAEYPTRWIGAAMTDAGQGGDVAAGDGVYTVQLPGALQRHRRLIRYRIRVSDAGDRALTVPYPDDPQPNFAYFVYNGAPAFVASKHPGVDPEEVFTTATMNSLAICHLITKKTDTEKCTWLDHDMTDLYRYRGTLVYGGKVYDHIIYRARGGTWRYAMRKNMWKIDLSRAHYLEARDNFGRKYPAPWSKLNLGACIQQRDFLHRGEQGMFESVGFALFNLAGLEACQTHFLHFRIIDEAAEDGRLNAAHPPLTTAGTQFDGDFWGLYLAVEELDGRFLDAHQLPDGNLYKMENGTGELKNQCPTGVSNKSDLIAFMNGYKARPASPWWRANVDLARYYDYRAIIEAIHHYDDGYGKNYFYFLNPETAYWSAHPWDLDLTWADNMYGNGEEPFKTYGILNQPDLLIEYQNRMREIRDLLFNPEQTGRLIDELASFIYTPGRQSFVDADRAQWDYHWVMTNQAYSAGYANKNGKGGQGEFYKIAPTRDFAGMLLLMKDYVTTRGAWIDANILNDPAIPAKPRVTAACPPAFPLDRLRFQTTAFQSPHGRAPFAALQWRIAEVSPPAATGPAAPGAWPADPLEFQIQPGSAPGGRITARLGLAGPAASALPLPAGPRAPAPNEFIPVWQSAEITAFSPFVTVPPQTVQAGRTYRVRSRVKDAAGKWSHWSDPVQFLAGPPAGAAPDETRPISTAP